VLEFNELAEFWNRVWMQIVEIFAEDELAAIRNEAILHSRR
jgi:hypothetical protein